MNLKDFQQKILLEKEDNKFNKNLIKLTNSITANLKNMEREKFEELISFIKKIFEKILKSKKYEKVLLLINFMEIFFEKSKELEIYQNYELGLILNNYTSMILKTKISKKKIKAQILKLSFFKEKMKNLDQKYFYGLITNVLSEYLIKLNKFKKSFEEINKSLIFYENNFFFENLKNEKISYKCKTVYVINRLYRFICMKNLFINKNLICKEKKSIFFFFDKNLGGEKNLRSFLEKTLKIKEKLRFNKSLSRFSRNEKIDFDIKFEKNKKTNNFQHSNSNIIINNNQQMNNFYCFKNSRKEKSFTSKYKFKQKSEKKIKRNNLTQKIEFFEKRKNEKIKKNSLTSKNIFFEKYKLKNTYINNLSENENFLEKLKNENKNKNFIKNRIMNKLTKMLKSDKEKILNLSLKNIKLEKLTKNKENLKKQFKKKKSKSQKIFSIKNKKEISVSKFLQKKKNSNKIKILKIENVYKINSKILSKEKSKSTNKRFFKIESKRNSKIKNDKNSKIKNDKNSKKTNDKNLKKISKNNLEKKKDKNSEKGILKKKREISEKKKFQKKVSIYIEEKKSSKKSNSDKKKISQNSNLIKKESIFENLIQQKKIKIKYRKTSKIRRNSLKEKKRQNFENCSNLIKILLKKNPLLKKKKLLEKNFIYNSEKYTLLIFTEFFEFKIELFKKNSEKKIFGKIFELKEIDFIFKKSLISDIIPFFYKKETIPSFEILFKYIFFNLFILKKKQNLKIEKNQFFADVPKFHSNVYDIVFNTLPISIFKDVVIKIENKIYLFVIIYVIGKHFIILLLEIENRNKIKNCKKIKLFLEKKDFKKYFFIFFKKKTLSRFKQINNISPKLDKKKEFLNSLISILKKNHEIINEKKNNSKINFFILKINNLKNENYQFINIFQKKIKEDFQINLYRSNILIKNSLIPLKNIKTILNIKNTFYLKEQNIVLMLIYFLFQNNENFPKLFSEKKKILKKNLEKNLKKNFTQKNLLKEKKIEKKILKNNFTEKNLKKINEKKNFLKEEKNLSKNIEKNFKKQNFEIIIKKPVLLSTINIFVHNMYLMPITINLLKFHENFFFVKILFLDSENLKHKVCNFFVEELGSFFVKKKFEFQNEFFSFVISCFRKFDWKSFIRKHIIEDVEKFSFKSKYLYLNYIDLIN